MHGQVCVLINYIAGEAWLSPQGLGCKFCKEQWEQWVSVLTEWIPRQHKLLCKTNNVIMLMKNVIL